VQYKRHRAGRWRRASGLSGPIRKTLPVQFLIINHYREVTTHSLTAGIYYAETWKTAKLSGSKRQHAPWLRQPSHANAGCICQFAAAIAVPVEVRAEPDMRQRSTLAGWLCRKKTRSPVKALRVKSKSKGGNWRRHAQDTAPQNGKQITFPHINYSEMI
jgi:hypothetical protein